MKKLIASVLFVGLNVLVAGEFLGLVPTSVGTRFDIVSPVSDRYTVVGQTGKGMLVLGTVPGPEVRVLAAEPRDHAYYTVRLFDQDARAELAQLARILDFDGEQYLVEVSPSDVERLLSLRVMLGRVSLSGWKPAMPAPDLPPVTANPMIEQMVARVNPDTVLSHVRRLQNYRSRYSTGDSCRAACEWVRQRFLAYGCDTVIMQPHRTGHAPNVIGVRYGTAGRRNKYAIISGHIDSYAASNAPGADDNASGTAATLEACRVTQGFRFSQDLRFIAWTGEEFGLYGSEAYANEARARGDTILGVLNFDMIGYVDAAPEDCDMMAKIASPPCEPFCDWFIAVADTYTALPCRKRMMSDNQNSDHGPFWNNGYVALTGIEDFWPTNPHYHTSHDSIGAGYNNNEFCTEVTRAALAAIATLGEPIPSTQPMVGLFRTQLDDASGNNNGHWDAGESVAVYLTLKNFGLVTAHNVQASIATGDPYVTLFETSAGYGTVAGQDTARGSNPFTMKAATNTPREHLAEFTLTITSTETTWVNHLALRIGEYLVTDPVPDGPRQPPLYWAYDDVDTGFPQHPTYDWVEIRTLGTRIAYAQNDDVAVVSLPTGFGPFVFYGQRYTQVSVSADGWLAAGNYTQRNYSNTTLPNSSAPPAVICANWDDLYPDYNGTGFVYWYHDAANHRFIVEFDSVKYYSGTVRDKFQFIIYDTTRAAPDGNSVIVVQYMTANGFASSTVGLQDPSQTIGIQDLDDGALTHGAAPIVAGRAIKYTTTDPTGMVEQTARLTPDPVRLSLSTNPVSGIARVHFSLPDPGRVELAVYDRAGRRVLELVSSTMPAGRHGADWDARELASGVYFLRLDAGTTQSTVKVVLNR